MAIDEDKVLHLERVPWKRQETKESKEAEETKDGTELRSSVSFVSFESFVSSRQHALPSENLRFSL
jgi:hypothetical protein